ncbi:hypothetical protein Ciccas_003965 [Cichlidogyrus casuarinus]|uniref:Uncharacterized protein n=1 Tax=Cichlidogyrus casuarinus TaxID=1844966 RepID=A0ABD2QF53_9PLAT
MFRSSASLALSFNGFQKLVVDVSVLPFPSLFEEVELLFRVPKDGANSVLLTLGNSDAEDSHANSLTVYLVEKEVVAVYKFSSVVIEILLGYPKSQAAEDLFVGQILKFTFNGANILDVISPSRLLHEDARVNDFWRNKMESSASFEVPNLQDIVRYPIRFWDQNSSFLVSHLNLLHPLAINKPFQMDLSFKLKLTSVGFHSQLYCLCQQIIGSIISIAFANTGFVIKLNLTDERRLMLTAGAKVVRHRDPAKINRWEQIEVRSSP